MEIEDDPVIDEIPVYLCKELSENLYLFQFPNRFSESSQIKNVISSRVKPENGVIEIDCGLETDSQYYDTWIGGELASDDSCSKTNSKDKENNEDRLMDKLTLASKRSVLKKDINCYSVATVYDEKFCITPIRDAVRFLPTHQHREKVDKSSKDSESDSDDEIEDTAPAVPVTVKFTQKNQEKLKATQEQSHQHQFMKSVEEPWCEANFYNNTSSTAMRTIEGLTRIVSRNRIPMLSMTENQYLDVLIPQDTSDSV